MIRAARAVYFSALGIWVGGMATLAFVVAPTVFRTAATRGEAGKIFGSVLHSFGLMQLVLGVLVLLSLVFLRFSGDLRPGSGPRRIAVVALMLALVCASQFGIAPAIEHERDSIPNFESVPAGVPARAKFDSLHAWSVRIAGCTLLLGAGLLVVSAARAKSHDGA